MLDNIASRIPPVIEDLRAQDMPTNTPGQLIPFLRQPLMAQLLGVKVVHLEGAVVDMRFGGIGAEEDAVVVYEGIPEVEVGEHGYEDLLAFVFDVEEVGWHNVEVCGVELEEGVEFLGCIPEMTKLSVRLVSVMISK